MHAGGWQAQLFCQEVVMEELFMRDKVGRVEVKTKRRRAATPCADN